eukprot:TRINITY_DN3076_c0_g1_i2.p1 TRINITY_DN3076_c0_g1~~TRINITY_DN3076_c0_g1_i2.p1  ORF type:complete len:384 (+),score=39.80 TRINITY_DN3076_c0_g1_i2:30-1181(+)
MNTPQGAAQTTNHIEELNKLDSERRRLNSALEESLGESQRIKDQMQMLGATEATGEAATWQSTYPESAYSAANYTEATYSEAAAEQRGNKRPADVLADSEESRKKSKSENFVPGRRPCRYFQRLGYCREGNTCSYSHVPGYPAPYYQQSYYNPAGFNYGAPDQPKTEHTPGGRPCRYFQRSGHCREGNACTFSHVIDPNSTAAYYQQAPYYVQSWQQELRKIQSDVSQHVPSAVKAQTPCRYIQRSGFCRQGNACPYSHAMAGSVDPQSAAYQAGSSQSQSSQSQAPAAHSYGPVIPQALQDEKKSEAPERVYTYNKPCRFFLRSGHCREGNACTFSHAPVAHVDQAANYHAQVPAYYAPQAANYYAPPATPYYPQTTSYSYY